MSKFLLKIYVVLLLFSQGILAQESNQPKVNKVLTSSDIIFDMCFAQNGEMLVIPDNSEILIYSFEQDSIIRKFIGGHNGVIQSVDLSTDNRFLVSAGRDGTVVLWDYINGTILKKMKYHSGVVTSVKFDDKGNYIASGGADKSVVIYDITEQKIISRLTESKKDISKVVFSNSGDYLITSGEDRVIRVYETKQWVKKDSLVGHKSWVRDLTFSENDSIIISCSDDKKMIFWQNTGDNFQLMKKVKNGKSWLLSIDVREGGLATLTGTFKGNLLIESPINSFKWKTKYPINKALFIPNSGYQVKVVAATFGNGVMILN